MPAKKTIPNEVKNRIAESYLSGLSGRQIAKSEGLDQMIIYNVLRELGVAIRSRSDAAAIRSIQTGAANAHRGKSSLFYSEKSSAWISTDSSYEYARAIQLESDSTVASFRRCRDMISYSVDGKTKRYNPDFEVTSTDGSVRVDEVKPKNFLDDVSVIAKSRAASSWYEQQGKKYLIVTEEQLGHALRNLKPVGLASIDSQHVSQLRAERRRQVSRDSARRVRSQRPATPEQRAKNAARQLARYKTWRSNATQAEIDERRRVTREAQRRYRMLKANGFENQ